MFFGMKKRNITRNFVNRGSNVERVSFSCLIWVSVCCYVSCIVHVANGASFEEYGDISDWYTRYEAYPPYCSAPSEMKQRIVPPLTSSLKTKLLHATTIIRHGQRTPYRVVDCWDSFWKAGEETATWNCELNTMMSPPAPPQIKVAENSPENTQKNLELAGEGSMFLFEKRYDGLPPPLKNEMNGTCQMGQLLLRGYVQELKNGNILRDAYLKYSNSSADHDDRLTLFDVTKATTDEERAAFYQPPNFYYRADDDQRTLMSGQALLRGLFHPVLPNKNDDNKQEDPVIALHTADRSVDILSPDHSLCPRLTEISEEALQTEEFQNYNNSISVLKLRQMMEQELGTNFEHDAMDCLMTTICTDRKLPDVLNDFHNKNGVDSSMHQQYGNNIFERLAELSAKSFLFPFSYKDAFYSKLAMGPLWDSILKNILPFSSTASPSQGPKLALFSGHDTTIMPILATLGGNVWNGIDWTPYASMLIIEVHEILDNGDSDSAIYPTDRAFRLLYNGQILTDKVEGCPINSELCDLSILLNRVKPFATSEPDCTPRNKKNDEWQTVIDENPDEQKNNNNNNNDTASSYWIQILTLCILCSVLSSVGTFYVLNKRMPFFQTKRSLYNETKSLPDDHIKYMGANCRTNNTAQNHLVIDHAVEATSIT